MSIKPSVSFGRFLLALIPLALVCLGAVAVIQWLDSGPIMKCDPVDLKKDMTPAQVSALCGPPYRERDDREGKPWYPLLGDKRGEPRLTGDLMWVYGSVGSSNRNVNVYFTNDKLRSVQIFGDYK